MKNRWFKRLCKMMSNLPSLQLHYKGLKVPLKVTRCVFLPNTTTVFCQKNVFYSLPTPAINIFFHPAFDCGGTWLIDSDLYQSPYNLSRLSTKVSRNCHWLCDCIKSLSKVIPSLCKAPNNRSGPAVCRFSSAFKTWGLSLELWWVFGCWQGQLKGKCSRIKDFVTVLLRCKYSVLHIVMSKTYNWDIWHVETWGLLIS